MIDFEYDPEKALWRPGRRAFIFLMGTAAVGAMLPPGQTHIFPIGDGWRVNVATKEILAPVGSPCVSSVLRLHQRLADAFDRPELMVEEVASFHLPAIAPTVERAEIVLVNDWHLGPGAHKHLNDGVLEETFEGKMSLTRWESVEGIPVEKKKPEGLPPGVRVRVMAGPTQKARLTDIVEPDL